MLRQGKKVVLGIRREDPKRVWERRAPLTPSDVAYLLSKHPQVDVLVAPCHRRVFRAEEYEKAGAKVTSDLKSANVVLGIKEIPLEELPLPTSPSDATHLMFSHTHKGQAYNTPLLARFVAPSGASEDVKSLYPRLIDYELLQDGEGKRTVGFGWYAGVAGVLESLSSMAHYHLEMGIASPFLYTPRPHSSSSLKQAQSQLRQLGHLIASHGTPEPLGPFIIGLTGSGNVARGCLDMLGELPIQQVRVSDLDALVRNPDTDRRRIYLVHAQPWEYFERVDGGKYERSHYYESPQSYTSVFHEKVAPYLTLLLHGAGWAPGFPRLVSNAQLKESLEKAKGLGGLRFTNVGDISCDIEGGLEFLTKATTLSEPFFKARTVDLPKEYPSVQVMSVDILPTSLPYEASKDFSKKLLPYLRSMISGEGASNEYIGSLDHATVASKGVLSERERWLQQSVDTFYKKLAQSGESTEGTKEVLAEAAPRKGESAPRRKRILMLGSGMVAKPAVDMIAKHPGVELIIASNSLPELQGLVRAYPNVKYRVTDVSDPASYAHLIEESDVVISLLPVTFHPEVGKVCVQHGKHLVTASYISQAMADLDESAKTADVLLLNEIGLDPGIDHCSAIQLLEQIRSKGHEVVSFSSFCGGLPAPEDSHVPLRYKFSWRPQGVLSAATNPAQYLLNNQLRSIPGKSLLQSSFPHIPITSEFQLEGLPNRDSMVYCDTYNLDPSKLRTVIRGTLRYPGFSQLMHSFRELGFLDQSAMIQLTNWSDFIQQALSVRYKGVPPRIQDVIAHDELHVLLDSLAWLGLVPRSPVNSSSSSRATEDALTMMPMLPTKPATPLDIFAHLLSSKLRYAPDERDMVVLSHEIISRSPASPALETVHSSTLIAYGDRELGTAMSRTVGVPVAIAALRVVEGRVGVRGVVGPMDKSVYGPVLEGLEALGLGMEEGSRTVAARSTLGSGGGVDGLTVEQALVLGGSVRQAGMEVPRVDGSSLGLGAAVEMGGVTRFAP